MISREEAIRVLHHSMIAAEDILNSLPQKARERSSLNDKVESLKFAISALSQPERPKGRWIKYGYKWKCSECDSKINIDGTPEENGFYYCPNCGADMREEK